MRPPACSSQRRALRVAGAWPWQLRGLPWVLPARTGRCFAGETRANRLCCARFVSVGHGTSVLLELPDGYTLLYDVGRQGTPYVAGRSVASVLWSRGLRHLDALVLSHADADHFNAVPELLERFSVGNVYVSPMMSHAESPALTELWKFIAGTQSALRQVAAGDRLWARGSMGITVLHPPRGSGKGSDNANSLVLCVDFAGRRILLPGDLESPGWTPSSGGQRWTAMSSWRRTTVPDTANR